MDMHREVDLDLPSATPDLGDRSKSPQRLRYEAEVKIFKNRHGDLDQVRQNLGLSRRKICQLLLVDPSAWTRWTRQPARVPPHIYRALEWFMALNHKALTDPELARVFTYRFDAKTQDFDSDLRVGELESQIQKLNSEIRQQRRILIWLVGALVFSLVTVTLIVSTK